MWRDRLAKERASLLIAGVGVELCLAVNYADRRLLASLLQGECPGAFEKFSGPANLPRLNAAFAR
jgi:hypothetical protein